MVPLAEGQLALAQGRRLSPQAGDPMPPQPADAERLALIEQWITAGALLTHGSRGRSPRLASFGCGERARGGRGRNPRRGRGGGVIDAGASTRRSVDTGAEVDSSLRRSRRWHQPTETRTGARGWRSADATFRVAQPLALATAWTPVSTEQDPRWPQAQATAAPTSKEVLVEEQDGDQWYEVRPPGATTTASQPTLESIEPGDVVVIRVYRWKILDGDGAIS